MPRRGSDARSGAFCDDRAPSEIRAYRALVDASAARAKRRRSADERIDELQCGDASRFGHSCEARVFIVTIPETLLSDCAYISLLITDQRTQSRSAAAAVSSPTPCAAFAAAESAAVVRQCTIRGYRFTRPFTSRV